MDITGTTETYMNPVQYKSILVISFKHLGNNIQCNLGIGVCILCIGITG